MVDAERIGSRLDRLEHLIELLDEVHTGGLGTYLADERLRAMTERWLQLADGDLACGASLLDQCLSRQFTGLAVVGREERLVILLGTV